MFLIRQAILDKVPTLTSIVSESFPHLKRGAIRDFLNIIIAQEGFEDIRWNKTDYIYTFPNGSKIEFFSADQPAKVRGPRRDRLFINEANNVSFETFEQLEVRTKEYIFIDYNPVSEFWVHTNTIDKENIDFLIFTYKDNEVLEKSVIQSIEQRKNRPGWWQVYGEGLLGHIEGQIYKEWKIIDSVPYEARLECYGLDFGYHPDPAAVVAIYYYNGGYILDEVFYQLEASNRDIATLLKNLPKALVVADSAEPKSISEIKLYGINIIGSQKGPESVRKGIKDVQNLSISLTKTSVNLLKEYRNYLWMVDSNGKIVSGIPDKHCADHGLTAARYGLCSLIPVIQKKEILMSFPRILPKEKVNPGL